jgi:ribonuclease HI
MSGIETKPTILKVWTDGALRDWSRPKVIGMAAVTCYRGAGRREEPEIKTWRVEAKQTSSMHAELFAIQCAIEAIPTELKHTCHLIVITDCLDAVQCIRGNKITPRYRKLVYHIRDLMRCFPKARIFWCRAHSGHKWNELANEEAQKCAGTRKNINKKRYLQ